MVEAFILAARSNISGEIFNVGSGTTHTINELVKLLGGERRYVPRGTDEIRCMWADITKIQKMLGWEPKVGFEEGIKRILADFYQENK